MTKLSIYSLLFPLLLPLLVEEENSNGSAPLSNLFEVENKERLSFYYRAAGWIWWWSTCLVKVSVGNYEKVIKSAQIFTLIGRFTGRRRR